MRLKSIVKGAGSFVIPRWRNAGVGVDGAYSAEGSYALFMRYVHALYSMGRSFEGSTVLELGPGASLGLGFGALICGAKRFYAYDLVDHTDPARDLAVFNEMLVLFQTRASVSTDGFCARIFPVLENTSFPVAALPDDLIARTMQKDRIAAIRDDIANRNGNYVRSRSSENIGSAPVEEPADIIMSESVLEHVDELEPTYAFFGRALAPNGAMVHLIDYGSHNLADEWNGHWACSPRVWRMVRGKRTFLIKRQPHQFHVDLLAKNGMKIIRTSRLYRLDGVTRDKFSRQFRGMSHVDAVTHLAQIMVMPDGQG